MAKLKVNGKEHEIEIESSTPLLWVLREQLGLTGTKYGCGIGTCGACTVHLNGRPVQACVVKLGSLSTSDEVLTIEGLSKDNDHPLQRAWKELDVPQCGYCQPGVLMTAAALLERSPEPTDAEIDASVRNICRCGTFNRIRRGIHRAAAIAKSGGKR